MTPAARPAPPVVVVTGPTASGKPELAVELAVRFDAEIVNADSMQVYRYMDIGTSKPGPELRAKLSTSSPRGTRMFLPTVSIAAMVLLDRARGS